MNNRYKSIKQVLISILRIAYNIIRFIAKSIYSIIVFLLKVLFAIIGLLFKTSKPIASDFFSTDGSNWTHDDDEFVHAFYSSYPMATSRDAQKLYSYGPIFFSKQFCRDDHKRFQKKCRKNWMYFLNDVANQRMFKRINW